MRLGIGLPGPLSASVSGRDVAGFWEWFWSWIFFLLVIAGWIVYWIVRGIIAIVQWCVRTHRVRKVARLAAATGEPALAAVSPEPLTPAHKGPGVHEGQSVHSSPLQATLVMPQIPALEAIVDELNRDNRVGVHSALPRTAPIEMPLAGTAPVRTSAEWERLSFLSQKRGLVFGLIAFGLTVVSSGLILIGFLNQGISALGGMGVLLAGPSGILAILAIVHSTIGLNRLKKADVRGMRPIGLPLGIVAFCLPGLAFVGSAIISGLIQAMQRLAA